MGASSRAVLVVDEEQRENMVFSPLPKVRLFLRAAVTALMFSFAAYVEEADAPTVRDSWGDFHHQVEGNKKIEKDAILGKIKSRSASVRSAPRSLKTSGHQGLGFLMM